MRLINFFNVAIEVLVDLREAVLQIGRHFHLSDPRLAHIPLVPDYSMDSHAKDHEVYTGVMRSKKRRAKALLDFERHDDDELGFRKNDVITIISQKVSAYDIDIHRSRFRFRRFWSSFVRGFLLLFFLNCGHFPFADYLKYGHDFLKIFEDCFNILYLTR